VAGEVAETPRELLGLGDTRTVTLLVQDASSEPEATKDIEVLDEGLGLTLGLSEVLTLADESGVALIVTQTLTVEVEWRLADAAIEEDAEDEIEAVLKKDAVDHKDALSDTQALGDGVAAGELEMFDEELAVTQEESESDAEDELLVVAHTEGELVEDVARLAVRCADTVFMIVALMLPLAEPASDMVIDVDVEREAETLPLIETLAEGDATRERLRGPELDGELLAVVTEDKVRVPEPE
jgi:hypothetical protein